MSVGADSLMGHLDMNKLLSKEILEKGRVISNKDDVSKQDEQHDAATAVSKKEIK